MQFNFYVRRVVINNLVSGSSKGKLDPPGVQQVYACLQKMSQCVAAFLFDTLVICTLCVVQILSERNVKTIVNCQRNLI